MTIIPSVRCAYSLSILFGPTLQLHNGTTATAVVLLADYNPFLLGTVLCVIHADVCVVCSVDRAEFMPPRAACGGAGLFLRNGLLSGFVKGKPAPYGTMARFVYD